MPVFLVPLPTVSNLKIQTLQKILIRFRQLERASAKCIQADGTSCSTAAYLRQCRYSVHRRYVICWNRSSKRLDSVAAAAPVPMEVGAFY